MIRVAIETATVACAVALDDGAITEVVLDTQRRHTETLMEGLVTLVEDRAHQIGDVTTVVIDRGPGLFTGLRVGLATAAALAQALGAELVAVTSLETLAASALRAGVTGEISALVDGRRGEVFAQRFALSTDSVTALTDPVVTRVTELVAGDELAPVVVGDGAARYREDLTDHSVLDIVVPSPAAALWLAQGRAPTEVLEPLYLREADAVANFETRRGRE